MPKLVAQRMGLQQLSCRCVLVGRTDRSNAKNSYTQADDGASRYDVQKCSKEDPRGVLDLCSL
jgi:hypothetical protein